jgi:hypothetical protein
MVILITTIHVIVCFFLIIVVLLQSGKSGDIVVHHHLYADLDHAFGNGFEGWQQFRLGPARHHAVADQDAAGNARANASEVVVSRRSSGFSQDRFLVFADDG